jgi:hypothetical protein
MLIILDLAEDVVCNRISARRLTVVEVKMLDREIGEVDTIVDG